MGKFTDIIGGKKSSHSSFVVRMNAGKDRLYDIRYNDGEFSAYVFILIDPEKEIEFSELINSDNKSIIIADYGRVLSEGEGEPSEELIQQMKENYDIKYNE